MRVFPQKPQYILVSNNPSHQKRTNPFSRAEKIGIAVVVVLFLTYLVIFMQAVFNYFQHQQTQNAAHSRTHINPNSVQQGHSLDNISQGYPSFVAIPKAPVDNSADIYKDFLEHSDTKINADNVVQQLDNAISNSQQTTQSTEQTTQLAKLDHKQDQPKTLIQPQPLSQATSLPKSTSLPRDAAQSQPEKTSNESNETVTKQTPTDKITATSTEASAETNTAKVKTDTDTKASQEKSQARETTTQQRQASVKDRSETSTEKSTGKSTGKSTETPSVKSTSLTAEKTSPKPTESLPRRAEKSTEPPSVKSTSLTAEKTSPKPTESLPRRAENTANKTANSSQDSFAILEQSLGL